jgi:hypothetical protein
MKCITSYLTHFISIHRLQHIGNVVSDGVVMMVDDEMPRATGSTGSE